MGGLAHCTIMSALPEMSVDRLQGTHPMKLAILSRAPRAYSTQRLRDAAIERGHVKPTVGRGTGLTALLWRDLQRLTRFPRPLIALAASVVAPAPPA